MQHPGKISSRNKRGVADSLRSHRNAWGNNAYIRNAWGNSAPPVFAADVAQGAG
jgi:hypothetical protein